jgi:hypothetical protein
LHIACLRGHLTVIKALVTAGADINAKDIDNNTKIQGGIGDTRTNRVKKGGQDISDSIKKILFNDTRMKSNSKLIPIHNISDDLKTKLDNEKKIINDMIGFLNKLEFDHQSFNIKKGKESNNISVNSNIPITNPNTGSDTGNQGGMRGKTNNMNNKCRKLDNDFQNLNLI